MDRREFLKGCASFAALAAVRGFGITNLLFDNQIRQAQAARPQGPPPNNRDLLVLVFVRGGLDGLNLLVPFNTSPQDRHRYYNACAQPSTCRRQTLANRARRLTWTGASPSTPTRRAAYRA